MMTPDREKKLRGVAAQRQTDAAVVLENVHDPHNISAVLRTCDSVGIKDVYIIYTDPRPSQKNVRLGKRSSAGARKWVDVHVSRDLNSFLPFLRGRYPKLLCARPGGKAASVFQTNFTEPCALIFGNEHSGVSRELDAQCDGAFMIPQAGMVKSLNISVACAVTLYEMFRQRQEAGMYRNLEPLDAEHRSIFEDYLIRHEKRRKGLRMKKIN